MFDRKEVIQDVMETVIENTDLDPGEVNKNISKVMATMEKANKQFEDMDEHVGQLLNASENLDQSGTQVAQAGVEMARASQALAESVNDLNETQQELSSDMEDLQGTLDRLETYMPEE